MEGYVGRVERVGEVGRYVGFDGHVVVEGGLGADVADELVVSELLRGGGAEGWRGGGVRVKMR